MISERGRTMPVDVKRLIAETLLKLLQTKRLEKITVKELVDECGISRQAFYYHFQDILDVVEWWAQETNKRLISASLKAGNAREALTVFLDFVIQFGGVVQNLLESRWRDRMEQLLGNTIFGYLSETLRQTRRSVPVSPADLEAYLHFCSYGLTGLLLEYVSKGNLDRDAVAEQMYRISLQIFPEN